jgi:hypothetical protein
MAGGAFQVSEVEHGIWKPSMLVSIVFVAARADSHALIRIQLLICFDVMRIVAAGARDGSFFIVGGVVVNGTGLLMAPDTDRSINTLFGCLVEKMHIMTLLAANAFYCMHA